MASSPPYRPATLEQLSRETMNFTSSTAGSKFVDSAIDIDQQPLTPLESTLSTLRDNASPQDPSHTLSSQTRSLTPSPSPPESNGSKTQISVSTRLAFLSSLAVAEQSMLPSESFETLHSHLDIIQRALTSSPHEPPPPAIVPEVTKETPTAKEDPELVTESHAILAHLTNSLATLRKRHEDTLHLHSHLISKLNTLTSTSLSQTRQMQTLTSQNADLTSTTDDMRTQILELESRERLLERRNSTLAHRLSSAERANLEDEVALEAMSAAVGGLEGWMDSFVERARAHNPKTKSNNYHNYGETPRSNPAIRGRGRFRGRYNASSNTVGPISPPSTPSSRDNNTSRPGTSDWALLNSAPPKMSARDYNNTNTSMEDNTMTTSTSASSARPAGEIAEFEEGIRSWIKGFRDVEESIRTRIRGRKATAVSADEDTTDIFDTSDGDIDDDDGFGEFERAQ